jgi:hypothetical protein
MYFPYNSSRKKRVIWIQAQYNEQSLIPMKVRQCMVQNCILNLNFVNIFLQNIEEYVVLQGQANFFENFCFKCIVHVFENFRSS